MENWKYRGESENIMLWLAIGLVLLLAGLVLEALSLFTLFLFFGGLKEAGELPL